VLLPAYTGNPDTIVNQANAILGWFLEPDAFGVVMITTDLEASIAAIRGALIDLGVGVEPA
jgi:hypothetical protein